jgi:predicted phosphoribosyltransferase
MEKRGGIESGAEVSKKLGIPISGLLIEDLSVTGILQKIAGFRGKSQ